MSKKDPIQFPKGWSAAKVRRIAACYDSQSDAETIANAEAAYRKRTSAWISVSVRLLPKIRRMIAAKR